MPRTFPAWVLAAAIAGTACAGTIPLPVPSPVHVTVQQHPVSAPPGATLGDLVGWRHLRARDGRLLSVTGAVLEADADPGRILLNGVQASSSTPLHDGDRIVVLDGTDRTEPVIRSSTLVPGRHPGDPEFTLSTYRIRRTWVKGRVSGDVVSVRDVATGHGLTPRTVALTFDDGPWPGATQGVMRVLHRFHVPATFFEVGYLVRRYPWIVRAVERGGFEIGDHSWDHPLSPPLAALSVTRIASEILRAKLALGTEGVHATLFRPPGGSFDDEVIQQARLAGMRVVLWSVDPQDWRSGLTPRQVSKAVLSHVGPGSIVLLHDGGGDAAHTIAALPAIIKGIRRRGLRFATVPSGG